jgi:hypothetical protein
MSMVYMHCRTPRNDQRYTYYSMYFLSDICRMAKKCKAFGTNSLTNACGALSVTYANTKRVDDILLLTAFCAFHF